MGVKGVEIKQVRERMYIKVFFLFVSFFCFYPFYSFTAANAALGHLFL